MTSFNSSIRRSRRAFGRVSLTAALAILTFGAAGLAPEPDPVPRKWQLDVKLGDLRLAKIETPGVGVKAYYYLTYTVTNASGVDVLLAPAWDLVTSDGQITRSGRNVPGAVTKQLLEQLNNEFLEDQISIIGVLMQGEENAKDGLVVWAIDDLRVDDVRVFGAGFSGESKPFEFVNPTSGSPERVMLRKTLSASYATPGEIEARGNEPFPPSEIRWIMR
ncbi:MAG: hypothetical protein IT435_14810 [Phycisphaerales bacterium]|nr:hypothetical protein [Phycisphaerales bacterium]